MTEFMKMLLSRTRCGDGTVNLDKYMDAVEEGIISSGLLDKLVSGEERLYTPQQVNEMIGIDIKTIYYWIRTGILPESLLIGRRYFVIKSDLEALLERSKVGLLDNSKNKDYNKSIKYVPVV